MNTNTLKLKYLGIDTYKHAVIFLHAHAFVSRSEGFQVPTRVKVILGDKQILATLNTIENGLLTEEQASLSNYAWQQLDAQEGDTIALEHPKPLLSLSHVRAKVYGHSLDQHAMQQIIEDIACDRYSDIHIATFLTACAGGRLSKSEIISLTKAMINTGKTISWGTGTHEIIVDKHCIGGVPGNRTTPIIVPIVTAFGLVMPKTSSRAITSPAGTADTMEVLTEVNLDIPAMRKVVEKEGGCIVWGGSVDLSPADDVLIRVERVLNLDTEGQLIASVLSKKISAGSTHLLLDIPTGPTAKVRSLETAKTLKNLFKLVAHKLNIQLNIIISDGSQPIGRGIGPALEAQDVLAVLQNHADAPQDLREHALTLAGKILEFSPKVGANKGKLIAVKLLEEGVAWQKFQAICQAQGGIKEPKIAAYTHTIAAPHQGKVTAIDNRQLANLAKLAGAPEDKAAGIVLHTPLETVVEKDQPLFTIHAESQGELRYTLSLLNQIPTIVQVEAYE
ncbi:MAG: thymidine phosphorylase [Gammaproteobacteria bacterium RIFCSPHIGHO2_12_FULL_35_23]|nr:MAG: thymidine phosphorylase [Gammaproteobacteria bacterium RIFCSPHIGHO2_12_FULL_35_23]